MPSFQEMLDKFKGQGEFARKSTMQWFLNEIRETYKEVVGESRSKESGRIGTSELQRGEDTEKKSPVDSPQTQGDTRKRDPATDRQAARDAVANSFVSETRNAFDQSCIGKLFFYRYDAKTKEKLEYWDMFPIVIPFSIHVNGWTGMNLHYLNPLM